MALAQLVERIICDVKKIPCPDDKRVDVWTAMTLQISSRDSCDWTYVSIIMELINKHLKELKGKTIRSLWKETETGIKHQLDDEGFSVDSLRIDLKMELLELITKRAWEDAESSSA